MAKQSAVDYQRKCYPELWERDEKIRAMRRAGAKHKEIAAEFDLSVPTVCMIANAKVTRP